MKSFKMLVDCPSCGNSNDAMTSMTGESTPNPGDFTICLYCAAIMRYTDEKSWRMAEPDEIIELQTSSPEAFKHLSIAHDVIMERIRPFSKVQVTVIEDWSSHGNEGKA